MELVRAEQHINPDTLLILPAAPLRCRTHLCPLSQPQANCMNVCDEKFIVNTHSVAGNLSFVTSLMEWLQKMKKMSLQNRKSGCTLQYDKHKGGCINQTFSWRQKQNKHQGNKAGIQSTQMSQFRYFARAFTWIRKEFFHTRTSLLTSASGVWKCTCPLVGKNH